MSEELSAGGDSVFAVIGSESGLLRDGISSGIDKIALWTDSVLSLTNALSC